MVQVKKLMKIYFLCYIPYGVYYIKNKTTSRMYDIKVKRPLLFVKTPWMTLIYDGINFLNDVINN